MHSYATACGDIAVIQSPDADLTRDGPSSEPNLNPTASPHVKKMQPIAFQSRESWTAGREDGIT